MVYIPKRSMYASQKGGSGYGNGQNPNQEGGMHGYDNAHNPNQEGGIFLPSLINMAVKQFGGARTKSTQLARMKAKSAATRARLNDMARQAGMIIPEEDEDDYMPEHQLMSTKRRQKAAADYVARALSRKKAMAIKKAETAARKQAKRDEAKATTARKRAVIQAARERTRAAAAENRQNRRTEQQSSKRNKYADLLMVQNVKAVNPNEKTSNLHNLTSGWKLHGNKLGTEKPGKKNALFRFCALMAIKQAANPNSPYMQMLSDGRDLDVDKEYERIRRGVNMEKSGNMRFLADSPPRSTRADGLAEVGEAGPSGLDLLSQAVSKASPLKPKKRGRRKKDVSPSFMPRRSSRVIERNQSGNGRVQKGGAIPLLPIALAAAPLLGGLLKKIF